MSAELAARVTAAAAVLADYRRAADEWIEDETLTVPRPNYARWAFRLAGELRALLACLDREPGVQMPDPAVAQLAQIRLVLDAFDWATDDRQYCLEQIEAIVRGAT
jgi:hypothetical protein